MPEKKKEWIGLQSEVIPPGGEHHEAEGLTFGGKDSNDVPVKGVDNGGQESHVIDTVDHRVTNLAGDFGVVGTKRVGEKDSSAVCDSSEGRGGSSVSEGCSSSDVIRNQVIGAL